MELLEVKCPKCGEVFRYPDTEKNMFDEYNRFKGMHGKYVYEKYHNCKVQSSLERFNKGKVVK